MNSFWDFLWIFFWSFAFIAYLMTLFGILNDLFRDRSLGGWGKAAWLIFLVFLPFLTALVYLIARGGGMAERTARAAAASKSEADNYIRSVASPSAADEIVKAKGLLEAGTITEAEYTQLKSNALAHTA